MEDSSIDLERLLDEMSLVVEAALVYPSLEVPYQNRNQNSGIGLPVDGGAFLTTG